MEPAIIVESVSKRFNRGNRFDSLRDTLGGFLSKPGRSARNANEFLAVSDISFQVDRGEAFGIIGPNGAGKSTLLKLLAGIMPPDGGSIRVLNRVSALIELGAGFHPDLTGRENIFLNASILGMSRRETACRFDEIVEFAGIGEFLETPIKRYSSGMYARLGFAIAVHAEPDILLVDEVLSVGDRAFRGRCMDKMREFLGKGVAIVFVSHDLASVQRFCDRAMVMGNGKESFCGPAGQAVSHYWAASLPVSDRGNQEQPAIVRNVRLRPRAGNEKLCFEPGDDVRFEYDVEFRIHMERPSYGLSLIRMDDQQPVFETSSTRLRLASAAASPGDCRRVTYDFILNVPPGVYSVGLHVRERDGSGYAALESHAVQVVVESDLVAGGSVHLAPRFHVSAIKSESPLPHPELTFS